MIGRTMIRRAFTEHPASVGESYFEHMGMALSFSTRMLTAGIACFVHAFLPFLFKTTGKDCIRTLHDRMVVNRDRRDMPTMSADAKRMTAAE